MNVFLRELRAYRKSIIIWGFSMSAIAVVYILMFSAVSTDIIEFQNVLRSMPENLTKALGIYIDSISTLQGFYSFVFVYIVLCGAIQAMNIGGSIVSKEVSEKTADFLMTKPVSREKILTSKLLAALCSLIITNIIYFIVAVPMTLTVKSQFSMKIFLMISATLFFVQLIFMALGIIVSIIARKVRSVISLSLSTVFGFFIISMLGSIVGDKAIRYISPFKYYDLEYIIKNSSYEVSYIIIEIVFIVIAIVSSYLIYVKKDVKAI